MDPLFLCFFFFSDTNSITCLDIHALDSVPVVSTAANCVFSTKFIDIIGKIVINTSIILLYTRLSHTIDYLETTSLYIKIKVSLPMIISDTASKFKTGDIFSVFQVLFSIHYAESHENELALVSMEEERIG